MGKNEWEQEGGELGDLGPGRHPDQGVLARLLPTPPFDPRQWARSALAFFRRSQPGAELCLAGDSWRIEVGDDCIPPGSNGEFLGIEVWRT